ncbi:hypothetical protein AB8613_20880 [Vibrio sp. BS-M-Sm-2]|uniref:hypothetical protein n=1 Tax=Vibrio sp. BS-M-Sm-2 TaxID=3241167 RepID=UPI003557BF79
MKIPSILFTLLFSVFSSVSHAKYEGIFSTKVCNGYPVITGTVNRMNSTTAYNGYEDTWVEILDTRNNTHGGKIFYREPEASGYTPIINNARLALITGAQVKACINGSDIYAIEVYKL